MAKRKNQVPIYSDGSDSDNDMDSVSIYLFFLKQRDIDSYHEKLIRKLHRSFF